MKKNLLILIIFFIATIKSDPIAAQDIHFSQFFETPLLRNPALAGIFTGDIRVQMVYRTQWASVTVPYQTGSFNAEFKRPIGRGNDFITLGGEVLYDKAGTVDLSATHILPALNYHKSLSTERNSYLSVGFMGGWVQRRIDRSKITTNSQYDGTGFNANMADGETFPKSAYSYLDGSAGVSFVSQLGENEDNNIYLGLAYHHFNKATKISFYGNPNYEMIPKWVCSGGLRLNISEYSFFTIEANYSSQGPYKETIAGVLFARKLDQPDMADAKYVIHGGAYIRWGDAIIPVLKLEAKPVSIAMSYDANISQLKSASTGRGGFELSLTYQKSKESTDAEGVRCPKF